MKNLLLLICLLPGCLLTAWGEQTRLTVRSAASEAKLLNLSTSNFGVGKFLFWKNIQPGCSYSQELAITEEKFYTCVYCSRQYDLFISPGDEMEIKLYDDGKLEIVGENARLNNLLLRLQRMQSGKDKYVEQLIAGERPELNDERFSYYYMQYEQQLSILANEALPEETEKIVLGYIQARLLKNIYKPVCDSKVFGKTNQADIAPKYAWKLSTLKPEPTITYMDDWGEYLREWMYTRMDAGKIKLKDPDLWIAAWGRKIDNPVLRDRFMDYLVMREVIMGYFDAKTRDRLETAKALVKDSMALAHIEANIAKVPADIPASDLSDIQIENLEGELVRLGSFKGKYVFIDIWSTYCNPCIGEIPYLQKLEREMQGKPVVFLSISMDRDRGIWKKFLDTHEMKHNQFIMTEGSKHPIWEKIGLSGIPRFVLLDKECKVMYGQAYRPSCPILKCCLQKLK